MQESFIKELTWYILMKFYLDTAIWIDYYLNRADNFRPLGEWALKLMNQLIQERNTVLYSDEVIKELGSWLNEDGVVKLFHMFDCENLLLKVEISYEQKKEASILCKLRNVSFGDALHAVLARDNDAIVVSRDKHFLELLDIVDVKKPEELI